MLSLLITLLAGAFFLIGALISNLLKNKNQLYSFSIGLSATTLLGIIFFDLLKEIKTSFYGLKIGLFLFLVFVIFGFLFLFILDKMIPNHSHNHHDHEKNIKEHNNHLYHISFLTVLGMIIHNIIEGMTIFIVTFSSILSGFLMALSVGLHNIPIGMQVGIRNTKKTKMLILTLVLSTFIGGLLVFLFNLVLKNSIMGCLMSLTVGMTLYLVIFEFIKEIIKNKNKKICFKGILFGIILIVINVLIG